ncbi:short-chain dehydrogenase [Trichoderma arundinaceum]|uniref:Short-chain dehydrogenase n=1 Tax=Trichoderma arundinaceum TaxID=490622 RepID=A0A395NCU6_TRIAR|nr:short-chain dehydrogenase [Trichoderma arundinaceum]
MDPVTAVGLAGVILQFVELGAKVTKRVKDFSSAVDGTPKAFKQIRTELPLIVDGLRRIQRNIDTGSIDKETQEVLLPVVIGCLSETEHLDTLLEKALPLGGDSSWDRRIKALRSLAYDKKIEEIAESLDRYTKSLVFHQVIDNFNSTRLEQQPPPPYTDPFWLVPFDRNSSFVGRDDIFADIDRAFTVQEGSQPKAALCGLGGIGKSQVALEYCYRRRNKGDRCSIFWVNAATVARFEESFNRIASECGITSPDSAKSDAALLLKNWLETQHVGPWIIVVDNVDDKDAFFRGKMATGKAPSECIPHCQNGSLLFTTRSRDIAVDVANPEIPITIHELGKAEGLNLIRKRLRGDYSEDLVFALLQELEYIPLAITQAVAFMVKRQRTIQQYLQQYRKSDATKAKFLNYEFSDHARPENTLESVAKTWKLSFESIRNSNRRAADLLCLINFFQHQGIPAILLQDEDEAEDDFDFQEAAALLKAFSFIDENDSVFSTHRLVQLATRWWLEEEVPEDVDRWAFEALKSIASQFPEPSSRPEPEYFKLGEILLPHAELILQYQFKATNENSELMKAKLLASSGRYIHWSGNYDEARIRFERSFEIRYKHLGEKHVDTMTSMGLLGWTLSIFDKDLLALPILKRLVENRREVLGEDDPRTIDSLSDLATAIALTEDYAESETMQREALARSERILGLRNNDTLNCMAHLAEVLDEQGKAQEAAKLLREVYEIKKDLLGHLHPDVLVVEHNLAFMLSEDNEKTEEAFSLYESNLRNKREVLGPDHSETFVTAYNLIIKLAMSDRVIEARELCEQCLAEASDGPHKSNPRSQEWLTKIDGIRQRLMDVDNDEQAPVAGHQDSDMLRN